MATKVKVVKKMNVPKGYGVPEAKKGVNPFAKKSKKKK